MKRPSTIKSGSAFEKLATRRSGMWTLVTKKTSKLAPSAAATSVLLAKQGHPKPSAGKATFGARNN